MNHSRTRTVLRIAGVVAVVVAAVVWYPRTQVAAGFVHDRSALTDATASASDDSPSHVIKAAVDDSGLFAYEVLRTFGGDLRVRLQINFQEPGVFEAYRQLNGERVNSLRQSGSADQILAAITFWSPLSIDDVNQVTQQANLTVLSYGAFGKNSAGQQASLYVWPTESKIEALPAIQDFKVEGIMTISALLSAGSASLDRLSSDERIALIDVMSSEARARIETELGAAIDVTQIGIPNPAWYLFSGEITR